MKKAFVILLAVCILLSAAGCSAPNSPLTPATPTEKVFSIDTYHMQITADSDFSEKTGGSFDLQITNDKCYISVMAYKYADLPDGTTPLDVYDIQNEDLFNRRDNVYQVEGKQTQTLSRGTAAYALFSAEKDGVKNYYATYLVDFPHAEVLAWVLITAAPSYLDSSREYLHNIVCSLTTTK